MSVHEGRRARGSGLSSPGGYPTPTPHDSDPWALSCSSLDIEAGPGGNIVVVRLAADVDMLTLPLVWAAVITALDHDPADLVVDLSGVGFCGVRGFGLLAAIARITAAGGIGYTISGLGRHHERGASLSCPPGQQIGRARSAAAAVTAIREDQALRPHPSHVTTSSRHPGSRHRPDKAAALDRSPRRTADPDGRPPPIARPGHLKQRLLGAVAIVWPSVSDAGDG